MASLALSFVKKFAAQIFLLIPVVFIFAIASIFVETRFDLIIFSLFGFDEFISNSFNLPETMNEKQLLAFLLTLWFIFTIFTSIFEKLFKFKFKINLVLVTRILHVLNFTLLAWMLISEDEGIWMPIIISAILNLISYASSLIYIKLSRYISKLDGDNLPVIRN